MPLVRINSTVNALGLHASPADPVVTLRQQAQSGTGPIILMVHGFKFQPGIVGACPHDHILSLDPVRCWKAVSWPRGLGFGTERACEGLGICFGWQAGGNLKDAYHNAARAGAVLARVVRLLRSAAPQRPIHGLGHSLGARVLLQALPHLDPGDMGRLITLNAAEFRGTAYQALDHGAGPSTDLIAVTGRENSVFDLIMEQLLTPASPRDRAMGRGMGTSPKCLDLRLDSKEVQEHLSALGFPLAPHHRRVCHWSPYLRPGAFELYNALLRHPQSLPLARVISSGPIS
ncbi:MAG: hypothetical protein CSA70_05205 [Rhodobacterales bacterium]|nr:MAG: hypothetical protein CSA70_05205 [Rhodobacterales bacterium]